ncbi:MAG: glycosyltransferase family 4 protein [Candidatus Jettenia sp.]|nr:MAG: glycosyltransferase family 4 protein [Candidatus Jettenia sp.]
MKIAFVSQPWNQCPPVKGGSISIWINEVARRLSKACDVVVYANSSKLQKKKELDGGVYYRRISTSFENRFLRYLKRFSQFYTVKRPLFASRTYYLGYVIKVARDIRKQKCDIVHVHNFSQFIPVIRAYNPGVKIILHMHCDWLVELDRSMIKQRLDRTDLIVGCSEYITEKIRRHFPEYAHRCQTIYNGVDIEHFAPEEDSGKKNNDAKHLLFVGRITPEKGLHTLLEAFQILVKQCPQVRMEIVGPHDQTPRSFIVDLHNNNKVANLKWFYDKNYLSQLKAMLCPDIASKVTFSGHIQQAYLHNNYRNADVLVNPSFSESFGMSLVEAMATEVPVVATRVGGMTEVIEEDKTGILVEPGDAPALAAAILRLLANEEMRKSMGSAARKRAVELFSWDRISEKLLCQYKNIDEHA